MASLLERTALFLLLVIIGLRPLIGEVMDSSAQAISVQGLADATPIRTVGLDFAVMAAVLLWLLARALRPSSTKTGGDGPEKQIQPDASPEGTRAAQQGHRLQTGATVGYWYRCFLIRAGAWSPGRHRKVEDSPWRGAVLSCQTAPVSTLPYRWTGLELGWAAMVVAGAIACANAGSKRAAIIAAINWLMLPVLTMVLVNLLRRPWQIRLLMGIIIASCAVQAHQCYEQSSGALADTEAMYLQTKEAFWKDQGVPLDSPTVALYERRLKSREATGFLSHPNVTAAHLLLGGMIALAWAYSRWRSAPHPFRKGFAIVLGLVGLILLGLISTTGSLGSATAAIVGIILGSIAIWKNRWLQSHRRWVFLGGWAAIGLATVAVLGHGWYQGRLPTATLDFRWKYWTASAPMIWDHLCTGVGPQNYGYRYLQYKTIDSPEEIQNAHNFIVQFAAEWGLIGLAGVVLMLLFGSWFATRRVERDSVLVPAADGGEAGSSKRAAGGTRPTGKARALSNKTPDDAHETRFLTGAGLIPGRPLAWGFWLTAAIMLVRIPMLGSNNPSFILVSTVIPAIIFGLAFAIAAIEINVWDTFIDDDLPFLATGTNAALFAFLLQDTINFALFVPGTAMTFFAALAIPLAIRREAPGPSPGRLIGIRRWAPATVWTLLTIGVLAWVALPVFKAQMLRWIGPTYRDYYSDIPWGKQNAQFYWSQASKADPLDPTAPAELAQWCVQVAPATSDPGLAYRDAVGWTQEAIRRSPYSIALYRQLMLIHQVAAQADPAGDHVRLATEAARRIVELYPTSPEAWISLGDRLAEVSSDGHDELRSETVATYRRALELDASRPAWEEIRKMPAAKRAEIEAKIRAVEGT